MNWVDYAVLAIVALSVVIGVVRGFVREVLSLLVWAAAFWVAFMFVDPLSLWLARWIALPSAQVVAAFAMLFLATLAIGGMINYLASELVARTGLGGTDRMVGVAFGAVRGMAVVVVLVLLAGFTPLPRDGWWQQSALLPVFERSAHWAARYLPRALGDRLDYRPADPARAPLTGHEDESRPGELPDNMAGGGEGEPRGDRVDSS